MTIRAKAIASLSGVFLLGAVCGALLLGLVVRGRMRDAQRLRDRQGFQEFFTDKLKLTETQRDSLREELERTYDDLAELRRAAAQQYGEVLDSFSTHVYPRLNPEQQQIFTGEEQRLRQVFPRDVRKTLNQPPEESAPPAAGTGKSTPSIAPQQLHAPSTAVPDSGVHGSVPAEAIPRGGEARHRRPGMLSDSMNAERAGRGPFAEMNPLEMGATPTLQHLQDRLNLTNDQTVAMRAILRDAHQKMEHDRQEYQGLPRLQMWAFRKNLKDLDRAITGVLHDDQMATYATLRQEMRDTLRARMQRRDRPPPP